MRSFTSIIENTISVLYTVTPVWTFEIVSVWKTSCRGKTLQHGQRYGDILFLYDMMNTYEWFCLQQLTWIMFLQQIIRLFQLTSISGQIRNLNIRHEWTFTQSFFTLICNEQCRWTREGEPAHTRRCLAIQRYAFRRYFEIGPRQNWFISQFLRRCSLWCFNDSCGQFSFIYSGYTFVSLVFISNYLSFWHHIFKLCWL